jgi:hypothetical protein
MTLVHWLKKRGVAGAASRGDKRFYERFKGGGEHGNSLILGKAIPSLKSMIPQSNPG